MQSDQPLKLIPTASTVIAPVFASISFSVYSRQELGVNVDLAHSSARLNLPPMWPKVVFLFDFCDMGEGWSWFVRLFIPTVESFTRSPDSRSLNTGIRPSWQFVYEFLIHIFYLNFPSISIYFWLFYQFLQMCFGKVVLFSQDAKNTLRILKIMWFLTQFCKEVRLDLPEFMHIEVCGVFSHGYSPLPGQKVGHEEGNIHCTRWFLLSTFLFTGACLSLSSSLTLLVSSCWKIIWTSKRLQNVNPESGITGISCTRAPL